MTPTPNPYRGAVIAFATMHGKEQLARGPFRTILGAAVLAPAGIDTDQFGSFAGDIPRTLTPQQAARSKALLGLRTAGLTSGLASEGSFTTEYGWLTRQNEHLLFLDQARGIELIESRTASFPVPPGRHILTSAQALSNATRLGFPTMASSCKHTTTCSGNTARTCILGSPRGVLRHSRLVITDARRIPGHRSSITRMEKTLALIRSRHC